MSGSIKAPLRIGTRGSPLALAQAREVAKELCEAHDLAPDAVSIEVIKTSGDLIQDRPLSEVGGKGLFTKELERALADGQIDMAVHSMKDVPTQLQDGHCIGAVLPREDVHDALVSHHFGAIADLPQGAVFGTSSLRRRAQLLALRPDLQMVEFRGNVQTRLKKLTDGVAVATILARAGLNRLGQQDLGTTLPSDVLLPAIAQGAVGIEHLTARSDLQSVLEPLHHEETGLRIGAERAFLRQLDGSCRTPIAGLAQIIDGRLKFRGEVLSPDGSQVMKVSRDGARDDAAALGTDAGAELLSRGSAKLF